MILNYISFAYILIVKYINKLFERTRVGGFVIDLETLDPAQYIDAKTMSFNISKTVWGITLIYGLVLLNVVFALYLYYVFLSDILYGKNTNTEE